MFNPEIICEAHNAIHEVDVGTQIHHAVTATLVSTLVRLCNSDKVDTDAVDTVHNLILRHLQHSRDFAGYFVCDENTDFSQMNDSEIFKYFMKKYEQIISSEG